MLTLAQIIETAAVLMENIGERQFSLRKLADVLGCDPMTILYHTKSKEGLLRALSDQLVARLEPPDSDLAWQERLRHIAFEYRRVALSHPQTFQSMSRFLSSGSAEYRHIETVQSALQDAGLAPQVALPVGLGWYASIIGLITAEISGFMGRLADDEGQAFLQLDEQNHPATRRIAPYLSKLPPEAAFSATVDVLVAGISHMSLHGDVLNGADSAALALTE
jgi:AcrR family transcriptional regulator